MLTFAQEEQQMMMPIQMVPNLRYTLSIPILADSV